MFICVSIFTPAQAQSQPSSPTDLLYKQISASVAEADFEAMAGTYHPDAILVSQKGTKSIASVIPLWKAAGEKIKQKGGTASVAFRFNSRQISETTAFESGVFKYQSVAADGSKKTNYVNFENLTIKRDGRWLTMMERQTGTTNLSAWTALE